MYKANFNAIRSGALRIRSPSQKNFTWVQGSNEERHNAPDAEKFQQCCKYFLQHSTFTLNTPYIPTWGRKLVSCPAPSNLGTSLSLG